MKHLAVSGGRVKRPQLAEHESFEAFLEGWVVRQEHFLGKLLWAKSTCHESSDDHLRDLITRVLAHYQQYYEHKSMAAQQDVFSHFAPTYFSSLELSFLWIAGFKPGLALMLASSVVEDLSGEQRVRLQLLVEETRVEERVLADDLALRTATAAKVEEILSPVQNVRFFTAVTQLQVNIRTWGKHRDAKQLWKADGRWTAGSCPLLASGFG